MPNLNTEDMLFVQHFFFYLLNVYSVCSILEVWGFNTFYMNTQLDNTQLSNQRRVIVYAC